MHLPFDINTIPLLAILLDATTKGLVLVLPAWGISRLFGKTSAAGRHTVWTLTVIALLALPILSAALPQWQLPLLPEWAKYQQAEEGNSEEAIITPDTLDETQALRGENPFSPRSGDTELSSLAEGDNLVSPEINITLNAVGKDSDRAEILATRAEMEGNRAEDGKNLGRTRTRARYYAWPVWVLLTWLVGAAVVLLPPAMGTLGAVRRVRRSKPVTQESFQTLLTELAGALHLRRTVRLRHSAGDDIPAVFGLFRPTILIPAGAAAWSDQRRSVVLLHELAHVKRRDCLTQLLGQLACVLYWFNPLAWLIARQLRIERERACDDLVLSAGQKPSDYADHLLEMVRTLRSRVCPSLAAVAMAKKSNFEHRLLAILDAARPRKALTKATTTAAFLITVAILLPLAMLQVTTKKADTKPEDHISVKKSTTQPVHDIGFYIITSPDRIGLASRTPMEDLTLAAKPFIRRDDIRYYDWKNHTIHLVSDVTRFPALMKRTTTPFAVVVDGRRLYVGMLASPVSSEDYGVPIILTDFISTESKRRDTVKIHPPHNGQDQRDNEFLKRVLGEMNLLKSDDVPAPSAVQPTIQPTWKDGVLSVNFGNGASVGIVGVSKLGPHPRVWWRADGRVDTAPYPGAEKKWDYQYEILLHRQAGADAEWIWDIPGARLFKPGGTPKDKHGKPLPNMQSLLVSYDGQRKTTNLRYAVSTGQ
ncbi:MAG: M56 family metallopeptidase, partial [Phycisphaerae bacterium]|nr:M56 family metallopeptidase [Phycisphaerae bacterium]